MEITEVSSVKLQENLQACRNHMIRLQTCSVGSVGVWMQSSLEGEWTGIEFRVELTTPAQWATDCRQTVQPMIMRTDQDQNVVRRWWYQLTGTWPLVSIMETWPLVSIMETTMIKTDTRTGEDWRQRRILPQLLNTTAVKHNYHTYLLHTINTTNN